MAVLAHWILLLDIGLGRWAHADVVEGAPLLASSAVVSLGALVTGTRLSLSFGSAASPLDWWDHWFVHYCAGLCRFG